jgi:hypothetical protein
LNADEGSQSAESIHAFYREALHRLQSVGSTPLGLAWFVLKASDSLCGTAFYFEIRGEELFGARWFVEALHRQQRDADLGEAELSANKQLCIMIEASLQTVLEHNPHLGKEYLYEKLVRPAERRRCRRLFLTQRNQVGLGPEAMRQGDVVVNLEVSTLPLVVRPQGSFFRFVGAARMPESMRLVAMTRAEEEGAEIETIEIR